MRRPAGWLLVVVFSVLIPLSVTTTWGIDTILDTNHYLATVRPLARDPVIIDYVATETTEFLFAQIHVPQRGPFATLTQPLFSPVCQSIREALIKGLHETWFSDTWDSANRAIHRTLVDFLSGKTVLGGIRLKYGDAVVLNLRPVLLRAIGIADRLGFHDFDRLRASSLADNLPSVTLLSARQVGTAGNAFKLLTTLRWLVLVATASSLLATVITAVDRRKALIGSAAGAGLTLAFLLLAIDVAGRQVEAQAHGPGMSEPVTAAIWNTVARSLIVQTRWCLLIAGVAAVVALWSAARKSDPSSIGQ